MKKVTSGFDNFLVLILVFNNVLNTITAAWVNIIFLVINH